MWYETDSTSQDVVALLLLSEHLPPEELDLLVKRARETKRSFWDLLLEEKRISEDTVADLFARRLGVPRVKLSNKISDDTLDHVPEALARRHFCLPIWMDKNKLLLCLANPADLNAIREVEFHTGCTVSPVVATRSEILARIDRYYPRSASSGDFSRKSEDTSELEVLRTGSGTDLDEDETREIAELSPVIKLVNLILLEALRSYASDIHIEPTDNEVRVRYRVDGLLRDAMLLPDWLHPGLVSRVKVLASMDISEKRRSQDGHIRVMFRKQRVDLRVSTLPTPEGEKLVLRILGSGKGIPSVTQLGMETNQYELLLDAIAQPQGMILVTGPTGSGKTTTLYSALTCKMSPELNIVTIEDPIEYRLPGISQVQVSPKAGITFANCLRSILRQDPDVVLLGEIRDQETAEVAFNAAMTGHLVLSSLHTNTALGTLNRLLELKIEPFLVSSCVNMVVAQRLVRKICRSCRKPYTPAPKDLERLGWAEQDTEFYRGEGCSECGGTGYSGRIGLFEVLSLTPEIQEAVNRKVDEVSLQKIARASGMQFLLDDAVRKIKKGVTTVEEVLRVIHLREESTFSCPKCRALIRASFSACPYCLAHLRKLCQSCGQELKSDWRTCPYCNHLVDGGLESENKSQTENWTQ